MAIWLRVIRMGSFPSDVQTYMRFSRWERPWVPWMGNCLDARVNRQDPVLYDTQEHCCFSWDGCQGLDQPDLVGTLPPRYTWLPTDDDTSTDTIVALCDEDVMTESSELSEPHEF